MIKKIPADKRHFNDHGWLKTYWLFSFSDYYDPKNLTHGRLRVFNDDVIAPDGGFPTHPHEEMEIVTLVMRGAISHKDSMGNVGKVEAGDVQRMSAGTGLTHSEFNLESEQLEFYQVWLYPDTKGAPPSYEQKNYSAESSINILKAVASGEGKAGAVTMNCSGTIYRSILKKDQEITYTTTAKRQIFVYVTSGVLRINGQKFLAKDQARIGKEERLHLTAEENTDFILIDTVA